MSREDHPVFCCKRFKRGTPSGSIQTFHGFACRVSPNKLIEPGVAELASAAERYVEQRESMTGHNWNRCKIPGCSECAFVEYWMDRAFEGREGR